MRLIGTEAKKCGWSFNKTKQDSHSFVCNYINATKIAVGGKVPRLPTYSQSSLLIYKESQNIHCATLCLCSVFVLFCYALPAHIYKYALAFGFDFCF